MKKKLKTGKMQMLSFKLYHNRKRKDAQQAKTEFLFFSNISLSILSFFFRVLLFLIQIVLSFSN